MNTCSRAARVFNIASAGEELPTALTAHAAGCDACQAALARTRRFDAELHAGATSLVTPAMPNLSDGAVDAVSQRTTRFGVLPALATVAGAVLAVVVLLSGYNMITAPIGSLETPAPTVTMSPFPTSLSPTTEPTATATVEPTPLPGGVPVEVTERAELPSCGHEVVQRTVQADGTWIDVYDVEARECFLAAYEAGEPAEFITDGLTVEGGRFQTIYRLLPSGELEIFVDSTQDPLSTPGWTRMVCLSIREVDHYGTGVPGFIGDECDEPVFISG